MDNAARVTVEVDGAVAHVGLMHLADLRHREEL
jgi:hypothetical protein